MHILVGHVAVEAYEPASRSGTLGIVTAANEEWCDIDPGNYVWFTGEQTWCLTMGSDPVWVIPYGSVMAILTEDEFLSALDDETRARIELQRDTAPQ